MAVSKTTYNSWVTLEGTLAEVVGALRDEGVSVSNVVAIFHDGTNYVAVYRKGP